MLEILLLVFLCKGIGKIIRGKGRSPIGFQILTVVLWFGSELAAGFMYGVYAAMNGVNVGEGMDLTMYGVALLAAACGAGLSFVIASLVPPAQPQYPPNTGYQPYSPNPGNLPQSQNPYNPYGADNPFKDQS